MAVSRIIDHALYPRQAVSDARTAYKEYCAIRVVPMTGNRVELIISALPPHNERDVVLNFMNFVLDKALEFQLASL